MSRRTARLRLSRPKRLADAQEAARLYVRDGLSTIQIGRRLDPPRSVGAVWNLLKLAGVETRPRGTQGERPVRQTVSKTIKPAATGPRRKRPAATPETARRGDASMKFVFTAERLARLEELWADRSLTREAIAADLGCSPKTIQARVASMGLGNRGVESSWDAAMIERLKDLHRQGGSYQDIADELNVTRGAVSGKLRRLKLGGRDAQVGNVNHRRAMAVHSLSRVRPPRSRKNAQSIRKTREAVTNAGSAAPSPASVRTAPDRRFENPWAPLDGSSPVPIVGLRSGHCRWPIELPGAPESHFCGLAISKGSYCPTHAKKSTGEGTPSERNAEKTLLWSAAA